MKLKEISEGNKFLYNDTVYIIREKYPVYHSLRADSLRTDELFYPRILSLETEVEPVYDSKQ